jgi:heat shock protein HslJ
MKQQLFIACMLVISACMTAKTNTTKEEITNRYWKLTALNGEPVVPVPNGGREPHMRLNPADQRVSGNGGCNSFGGKFSLQENNGISFSQVFSTQMACDNLATEAAFFKALNAANEYRVLNDTLWLKKKGDSGELAKFVSVVMQ